MQLRDATILVVDDEPYYREIASEWLQQEGCHVMSAADGIEALEKIKSNKVDGVLTDIRMPRMDGTELVRRIRASGAYIPAALSISGFSDLSAREAYDLGIENQLAKPISRKVLISALQKALLDREEIWALPHRPGKFQPLATRFDSMTAALERALISFGRGGFCLRADVTCREESSLAFELGFTFEQKVLAGQGIVRWIASNERLIGVEIVRLDEPGRSWLLALQRENAPPGCFIPRTAGPGNF